MASRVTKNYIIYKATSPSGKVYIGLTCRGMDVRMQDHFVDAHRCVRIGKIRYFYHALVKYGTQVQWDVVESGIPDLDMAKEREKFFVAQFKSNNPLFGYNGTEGGDAQTHPNADLFSLAPKDPSELPSLTHAARELGLQRHKFQYMIDRGYPYAGVTYTTTLQVESAKAA